MRSAMARPMPRVEPVTTATWLASENKVMTISSVDNVVARLHAADPKSVAGLAFPVVASTFSHQVGEYPSVQVQADISQGTGSIESAPQRS
jgi:hypothetical protein